MPLVVLVGLLAGALSGSGGTNWYAALEKPKFQPPSYLFGHSLRVDGVCARDQIQARDCDCGGSFIAQLVVNLLCSPIFFGMHQISFAFWWVLVMLGLAVADDVGFLAHP